jgi:hypothetical protein
MYSNAPSVDLYYLGQSFDSSDYVDYEKIENKDKIPSIQNGGLTLSVSSVKNWSARSVVISPESNGYSGSNHSAYIDPTAEFGYKYFFLNTPTARNKENIQDNNPLSFFEYEQINIENKNPASKDYEYKYIIKSSPDAEVTYDDWSIFKDNSLKLNVTLERETSELANFVVITPYFGDGLNVIQDVLVKKVEVVNEKNEVINVLPREIYISSSFIPSSLDRIKNTFYKEAKIYFEETKIKKINIYFEQANSYPTKVKHAFFAPDSRAMQGSPYQNQTRFSPEEPSVPAESKYPEIPWAKVVYNVNDLIPSINQPNLYKAEVFNSKTVDVRLEREIPVRRGFTIKVRGIDGRFYRITERFFQNFNNARLDRFSSITAENYLEYISNANVTSSGGYLSPYLTSYDSTSVTETPDTNVAQIEAILSSIIEWFNTTTSQGTKEEKFQKFNLDPSFNAVKEETNSADTKTDYKTYKVQLNRGFEILNAQRRAIGIRDISVGLEQYVDSCEMISRRYDVPSEIEYMTISSELEFSGNTAATFSDYVKYYISLDDGAKWIPISSIESPFGNLPEVIAFNRNIDQNFNIPGVSYFNQPDIPASVKSFLVKIEINKPIGENITPIIYSYKVGVKVRQV